MYYISGVKYEYLPNAGLVLKHVTLGSMGTYSVEVSGYDSNRSLVSLRSDAVVKLVNYIPGNIKVDQI